MWPLLVAMASIIPPDSPPRFIFWRRSAVVACSAASDLCTCCSCADIVTKAFAISSADIVAPPLRLPLVYKLGPVDDAAIGDHPFILELLSTKGRSLLVGKGAFNLIGIVSLMLPTVSHVTTSTVIVLPTFSRLL